ncbi:uncharacterized protein LOC142630594 [Castanea sativa]|uniref:uncharacterized protein LOC142630594 n=1 Tax=Castanea sativa TaxID=21020 RepID=UPI003F6510E7
MSNAVRFAKGSRLLDYCPGATQVVVVDQLLQNRQDLISLLKQNLVSAQARMKFQADLHRVEKSFNVGDWVYLKLQPYSFSVSCLKLKLGSNVVPVPTLPLVTSVGVLNPKPVALLQHRSKQLRSRTITKVLVQWYGQSPKDATWESLYNLQQQFPHLVDKVL